jgi:hypothetical protein
MNGSAAIVHEAGRRLRLRFAPGTDAADLRLRMAQLDGVQSVRVNSAARSLVVLHDGRAPTRRRLLQEAARTAGGRVAAPVRRTRTRLSVPASVMGAALAAALPPAGRPAVALALVAGKSLLGLRAGAEPTAVGLEAVSLATTALTGHPLTTTTSVLLSTIAEHWRDSLLEDTDQLLARLVPAEEPAYAVERGGRQLSLASGEIHPGDVVVLSTGEVAPVDGVLEPASKRGVPTRRHAGDRAEQSQRLRAERDAVHSRSARLRAHIRHALLVRDQPGPLTPDMERLMALPVAAAGLVLALTKDTGRTASMLQADPQQAFALAHPVAREAALYAAARHGALMSGLDSIERLAIADAVAFQDVGVLTDPYWHVGRIDVYDTALEPEEVRRWLARLLGAVDVGSLTSGIPDPIVDAWLDHGALIAHPDGALHVAGSRVLERTWGLPRSDLDRRSLARWVGVVRNGKLLARVQLESRLRPKIKAHFAALRRLGVKHIAVFTENPYPASTALLRELGADLVVAGERVQQQDWLDSEAQAGRRVALVHTSMREVLPPGGLSLCPVDADAGAHGVLLDEPLVSLLSARMMATELRRDLRRHFGTSMTVNVGLMLLSALAVIPPISVTLLRHGFSALLVAQSARLARRSNTFHSTR